MWLVIDSLVLESTLLDCSAFSRDRRRYEAPPDAFRHLTGPPPYYLNTIPPYFLLNRTFAKQKYLFLSDFNLQAISREVH